MPTTGKLKVNGIGNPHITDKKPIKHYNFIALGVLYPPSFEVTIPPIITPPIGADKEVIAK